jgi:chemotaxis protein methyltransferase CheR
MTLTSSAFSYVSDLVRRESAIVLDAGKEYLVEARLDGLARAAGTTVSDYVAGVQLAGTAADRAAIVEALTTNETSWFRDREPFEALTGTVIPQLLRANAHSRRISVWSAACSSGQEAYSIAMLLAEQVLPLGWRVDILATDISEAMVRRTRAGTYSQLEIGRGLPAPMLVRHLRKVGTQWRVSDQLRSMVRVQRLNLAAPLPLLPAFDLVFLRNVLIYFDLPTKRSILQATRRVMHPQGYLVLGGAETTLGVDDAWSRTPVGRFTLHRPSAAPAAPVPSTPPPVPARASQGW